jgi:cytochrome c biogenesis protein CcmG/thiol:disulfide interchange protein DsbE
MKRLLALLSIVILAGALQAAQPPAAPALRLVNLGGDTVSLEQFRGRPVVVDFWATWCVSCRHIFPVLNELTTRYGDSLVVLGVCLESAPKKKIADFVKKSALRYPILLDPTMSTAPPFGITAVPTLMVIDKQGRIVAQFSGADKQSVAQLKGAVARVMGGK